MLCVPVAVNQHGSFVPCVCLCVPALRCYKGGGWMGLVTKNANVYVWDVVKLLSLCHPHHRVHPPSPPAGCSAAPGHGPCLAGGPAGRLQRRRQRVAGAAPGGALVDGGGGGGVAEGCVCG